MTARHNAHITAMTGALLAMAAVFHFTGLEGLKAAALLISTMIAGLPIMRKAMQGLRMKVFSIELLVSIAVVGALLIGEYVESAVVTFLFLFGAYLEERTLAKTRSSLQALINMAPLEATVIRDGVTTRITADEVREGDHVAIRSGEKIPVDGTVVSGHAYVNEAAITGESVPKAKHVDDGVFSGTILDNGYLEVIAERVGDNTTFAKIIELVEEAQEGKTKTQKFLERFAQFYTPAIAILSALVYLFTRNTELALTFLVIACPGALVISGPVSIVAGIGNGARHGILIKGGEAMEKFAKVDTIVFDKTGTLTQGKPAITDIGVFDGLKSENHLLQMAAEAEKFSEHHLGQTIVSEAKLRSLALTHEPKNVEIIKGQGIKAELGKHKLIIGNRRLMASSRIPITTGVEDYAMKREQAGNTTVFVAVDGKIAGIISIADQVRSDAKQAIANLRAHGIKLVAMLTGDNSHTAELVGRELELDGVYAELLPENKVDVIKTLKAAGHHVAMVGDGINDAPAIATADVGISMGQSGTDVSIETADVVLMADSLEQFAHAYSLAKATIRNMKHNTLFAISTVTLLLIGVLAGRVFLSLGMLIHELSVLFVILNAIRLINFTTKPNKKRFFSPRELSEVYNNGI